MGHGAIIKTSKQCQRLCGLESHKKQRKEKVF